MNTKHTPTPWVVCPQDHSQVRTTDGDFVADCDAWNRRAEAEANAAFIVEAVNAHTSLTSRVAELEGALARFASGQCEQDNGSNAHCRIGPQPNGMTMKPCRVCAARALLSKGGR
jgi:hypothetical protein